MKFILPLLALIASALALPAPDENSLALRDITALAEAELDAREASGLLESRKCLKKGAICWQSTKCCNKLCAMNKGKGALTCGGV
ncbi:hypothetical protein BU24DRAFT_457347 [Aaosphaeria arxii CBS 175.79]|uniref:Invertebrate defensins family profile domain-containing protein n=1 Tax=Aaosphaeria arxii CBS 175.79 TaxID=1450172 RepID=A0A6A5Y725_9PLEO|nr:uncharacterized protein BU24DRAFT_457347 [Aaosphaeria arxii CBS 175.79]KAF2021365.1 hypothetical protein BU24DRAFT_457347 [Aaosphaeria arxii CBS 175.79]